MKTYVITGATSGIGYELVKYFAKDNIVFAGYRNSEKIEELKSISSNIIPFYVDYNKPETIEKATDFIKSKTNKIDTLFNVAGCVVAGALEYIPVDELRRQFDVNVFGHVGFSQNLLSLLDDGKIINISSMASFGIFPFISPYCASKRSLDILFNALLLETKKNIKVISIKPGVVATPLWSKSIKENETIINACKDYSSETNYLKTNALKNEKQGYNVQKFVEKIVRIEKLKNPKPSYCIGMDSVIASIFSKLPQTILNKIIKLKMKRLK